MLQAGCPAPLSSSLEAHRREIQRPARYMSNSGAFARTLICSHSSCGGVPSSSPTHAPHASSQGLPLWNMERGCILPAYPCLFAHGCGSIAILSFGLEARPSGMVLQGKYFSVRRFLAWWSRGLLWTLACFVGSCGQARHAGLLAGLGRPARAVGGGFAMSGRQKRKLGSRF